MSKLSLLTAEELNAISARMRRNLKSAMSEILAPVVGKNIASMMMKMMVKDSYV